MVNVTDATKGNKVRSVETFKLQLSCIITNSTWKTIQYIWTLIGCTCRNDQSSCGIDQNIFTSRWFDYNTCTINIIDSNCSTCSTTSSSNRNGIANCIVLTFGNNCYGGEVTTSNSDGNCETSTRSVSGCCCSSIGSISISTTCPSYVNSKNLTKGTNSACAIISNNVVSKAKNSRIKISTCSDVTC